MSQIWKGWSFSEGLLKAGNLKSVDAVSLDPVAILLNGSNFIPNINKIYLLQDPDILNNNGL